MNFRKLELFVMVVRAGNFSRAAKTMHLTQPTVSGHIDSLERELGVKLFERRGRQAVLTDAGKRFYPYAMNILRMEKRGRRSILGYKDEIRGRIKITASSTPGHYLLPEFLWRFKQDHPDVDFSVELTDSRHVINSVLNFNADLGFAGAHYRHRTLSFFPVFKDELVLIVPPGSNLARADKQIDFAEAAQEPCVMRGEGSATRRILARALSKKGLGFECCSHHQQPGRGKELCAAGIGCSGGVKVKPEPGRREEVFVSERPGTQAQFLFGS